MKKSLISLSYLIIEFLKMNKLNDKFSKLKSLKNSPRLFIVNYFDEIRNIIDIECENYLIKHGEEREITIQQQEEMIKEVDLFEKKCLSNLESDQCFSIDLDNLQNKIESLDKNEVKKAEKELDSAIYRIEKTLLMDQGIVFLNEEQPMSLFGALIIVKDEYLRFINLK